MSVGRRHWKIGETFSGLKIRRVRFSSGIGDLRDWIINGVKKRLESRDIGILLVGTHRFSISGPVR